MTHPVDDQPERREPVSDVQTDDQEQAEARRKYEEWKREGRL
jgi:hypothetical protein